VSQPTRTEDTLELVPPRGLRGTVVGPGLLAPATGVGSGDLGEGVGR
jgi:hypothetical protein